MTPDEFKNRLAPMVAENRNHEAVAFVKANLAAVSSRMTDEDRMLVADWMEGVEMALDFSVSDHEVTGTAPIPDAPRIL